MGNRFGRSCVLVLLVLASVSVTASSTASLSGVIVGREICEQEVCGAAIFVAAFAGQINGRPARGAAIGGIEHDPLPTEETPTSDITGGSWAIVTPAGTIHGTVGGGLLTYIDGIRYGVVVQLDFDGGSSTFHATLDHGPFPPTIRGFVVD